jgi:hypothetical protein
MKITAALVLAATTLFAVSCTQTETDGRKYSGGVSPMQGKMGVSFKRVHVDMPAGRTAATDGATAMTPVRSEPPGLLDRNMKPDEPGAEYWLHGEQSPNPVQSKMGIRVQRRKK